MDYFTKKAKHAYQCYKKGIARQKVYAVVEKGDKYVVLKIKRKEQEEYCLAGGGIEKGEDIATAIKREIAEELSMDVEFVRMLGSFMTKSKWTYKNKEFFVDDNINVVYTKFVKYSKDDTFGVKGEFSQQDSIAEIDQQTMLDTVVEFTKYGIKL